MSKILNSYREILLYLLAVPVLLSSCINDSEPQPKAKTLQMPVVMRIYTGQAMTKTPGDPGIAETFELPRYAYLFIYLEKNGAVYKSYFYPFNLIAENWVADTNDGTYITEGDAIYRYNSTLTFDIAPGDEWTTGRVYVAVSREALTLKMNGTTIADAADVAETTAETALRDVKFAVSGDNVKSHLQDIYSTPYNYTPYSSTYYGTLDRTDTNRPSVDLLLYHVAAKVDLMWNVESTIQKDLRITNLTLNDLYGDDAYLFRPMDNGTPSTTYTKTLIDTYTGDDVGSQWYGRRYIYTIPYYSSDNFPVATSWQFNGDTSGSFNETYQNAKPTLNAAFVPWVRGNITFKKKPDYN